MQTVTELFRRLEGQRITYAVLRNYETLPDLRCGDLTSNTDIDLVVASEELPRIRVLLAALAADCGWDVLTECDHFQRSRARHHNIEIFQFYRFAPLEFLQVDVFHGYLTWGLPLMTERQMLAGRVHDGARGLTHIDPVKENTFRLVQIHGLGQSARTEKKRARYRAKIVDFCRTRETDYLAFVGRLLGPSGVSATAALRTGDQSSFVKAMPLGKAYFFCRYAWRHPWSTAWQLIQRIRENRTRFHDDPCGHILAVHARTEQARSNFKQAMGLLAQLNVVDEWVDEASDEYRERRHSILEQGGLVVRWTDRARAAVEIDADDTPEEICVKVLRPYVSRHRAHYQKRAVPCTRLEMRAVTA